nr:putative glycoprotein [Serpentovirales sp.]
MVGSLRRRQTKVISIMFKWYLVSLLIVSLTHSQLPVHDMCGPGLLAKVSGLKECKQLPSNWSTVYNTSQWGPVTFGFLNQSMYVDDFAMLGGEKFFPIGFFQNKSQDFGFVLGQINISGVGYSYSYKDNFCQLLVNVNQVFGLSNIVFINGIFISNSTSNQNLRHTRLFTNQPISLEIIQFKFKNSTPCIQNATVNGTMYKEFTSPYPNHDFITHTIKNDSRVVHIPFNKTEGSFDMKWKIECNASELCFYAIVNGTRGNFFGSVVPYVRLILDINKVNSTLKARNNTIAYYNVPLVAYQQAMLFKRSGIIFSLFNAIALYHRAILCPYQGGYGNYCPKETKRCFSNSYESYFADIYQFYLQKLAQYLNMTIPSVTTHNFTTTWGLHEVDHYSLHSIDSCLHPILNNEVLNVVLLGLILQNKSIDIDSYLNRFVKNGELSYDLGDVYALPNQTKGYVPYVAYLLGWYVKDVDYFSYLSVYNQVFKFCNYKFWYGYTGSNQVYLPFCHILSGDITFDYQNYKYPPEFTELWAHFVFKPNTTGCICSSDTCLRLPINITIHANGFQVVGVELFDNYIRLYINESDVIVLRHIDISDKSKDRFVLGVDQYMQLSTVPPSTTSSMTSSSERTISLTTSQVVTCKPEVVVVTKVVPGYIDSKNMYFILVPVFVFLIIVLVKLCKPKLKVGKQIHY